MFITTLVLLFLIRLRFPKGKSISEIISTRYGRPTLQRFRDAEKNCFRTNKLELDINFLNVCKDYEVIPKFIKFKVYNRSFQYTRTYRSWQFKLLDIEISSQKKKLRKCKADYETALQDLKSILSFIDFKCIFTLIISNVIRKLRK